MQATIGHIILSVSDYARSEKFYDAILLALGFEARYTETGEWGAMKWYNQGEHNVWIRWDTSRAHEAFVRDVGLDHLAFRVETESHVNELCALVQSLGAEITRPPERFPEYSPFYYAFYFRDPDGIPLEIYYE